MARKTFVLCQCCALKLANDDESGCRDHHGHDHPALDLPADVVVSQGPHLWDGTLDLACHGHEGGSVRPGEEFWVAELMA